MSQGCIRRGLNIEPVRNVLRAIDREGLLAAAGTGDQCYISAGNSKCIGDKAYQGLISLAFQWWRPEANFQAAVIQTGKLVTAGIGLQVAVQHQRLLLPPKKTHGSDADDKRFRQTNGSTDMTEHDLQNIDGQENENG